jgi:MerR family transcriptional regulator, light-induced transcriptional regulator
VRDRNRTKLIGVKEVNIAALSRRTGVAPDTLRKWEQRYGVLNPYRTGGGQRRYTELDVARVEWLLARLAEGYRIGEASTLLGEGPSTPPTCADEVLESLKAAVSTGDHMSIARLLDQAFALQDVEQTLAEVAQPLLQWIGDGWAAGDLSVADEHLMTHALRGRLERLLTDRHGGVRGVAVLLCGPGERHELGLLMFGILLRADGWKVAYLGPDTPLPDAVALATRLSARLVAISVGLKEHADALRSAFAGVELPPDFQIVVGGAAACPILAGDLGVQYADHDLPKAVRELQHLAS